MSGHGYVSVSIPASLMAEIDVIVENETLGYRSRSAYIQEAIRNHLSRVRLGTINNNSTGSEGGGLAATEQPAKPAVTKPESDAPKRTHPRRNAQERPLQHRREKGRTAA